MKCVVYIPRSAQAEKLSGKLENVQISVSEASLYAYGLRVVIHANYKKNNVCLTSGLVIKLTGFHESSVNCTIISGVIF